LHFLGDNEQARALAEQALAINDEVGDGAGRARILIPLSVVAFDTGDDELHASLSNELLLTARRLGDQENVARALARLGAGALRRGGLLWRSAISAMPISSKLILCARRQPVATASRSTSKSTIEDLSPSV
jgi:hypothetical protein